MQFVLYGNTEKRKDISQESICGHEDISYRRFGLMRMSYEITSEIKKKIADKMGNNS